jgi:hypothetical protein
MVPAYALDLCETGPVTPWLIHTVHAAGLDRVCIGARHGHAVMSAVQVNQNQPRITGA